MPNAFQKALEVEKPLQIVGTVNAFVAKMAKEAGYQAIYLSGAGVANYAFGLPDIGETTLLQVAEEASRITKSTDLPLLVDVDTGWEDPENTAKVMQQAGVSAIHIEDQIAKKLCGHLKGIQLISKQEMVKRIQAAKGPLYLIARTDARSVEGLDGAIDRAKTYQKAGADAIFAEALTSLDEYKAFSSALNIPILANCTEFGKTPSFTKKELSKAGVQMILYPLSCTRVMHKSAWKMLQEIRSSGSQKNLLDTMQTRDDLYHFLNYEV